MKCLRFLLRACALVIAAFIIAVILFFSYFGFTGAFQRSKQLRTYTDLQIISKNIEKYSSAKPNSSILELNEIIEAHINKLHGGVDEWGMKIQYAVKIDNETIDIIIVSYGRDQQLDVELIRDYFDALPRRSAGAVDADIIFRNGIPISLAGR
jgi:hypothetical protein